MTNAEERIKTLKELYKKSNSLAERKIFAEEIKELERVVELNKNTPEINVVPIQDSHTVGEKRELNTKGSEVFRFTF